MDKQKLNYASFDIKFDNFQPIKNTGFVRGECKVAYAGENRNYSNIPKEAFENAEPTLYGIPVVGNWLEEEENFGGHDLLLETRGNKLVIKDTTIPYGFVPQDANPRWVAIEDENGNTKNYYTCDVILWYERFPKQVQFIMDSGTNQSMEIMVEDGEWDENWEYFLINEFYYSALCLLGRERDSNGNKGEKDVEPCFEDAEVVVNEFGFSKDFNAKVEEMKNAFEGGEIAEMNKTDKKEFEIKEENKIEEVKDNKEQITYEKEFKAMTDKYDLLLVDYKALQEKYKILETEVNKLKEYKNNKESEIIAEEKAQLIKDYSLLLTEDEMSEIVEKKDELSYKEIQIELSTIFSNKSLELVKEEKSKKSKDEETIVFESKATEEKKEKNKFAI